MHGYVLQIKHKHFRENLDLGLLNVWVFGSELLKPFFFFFDVAQARRLRSVAEWWGRNRHLHDLGSDSAAPHPLHSQLQGFTSGLCLLWKDRCSFASQRDVTNRDEGWCLQMESSVVEARVSLHYSLVQPFSGASKSSAHGTIYLCEDGSAKTAIKTH